MACRAMWMARRCAPGARVGLVASGRGDEACLGPSRASTAKARRRFSGGKARRPSRSRATARAGAVLVTSQAGQERTFEGGPYGAGGAAAACPRPVTWGCRLSRSRHRVTARSHDRRRPCAGEHRRSASRAAALRPVSDPHAVAGRRCRRGHRRPGGRPTRHHRVGQPPSARSGCVAVNVPVAGSMAYCVITGVKVVSVPRFWK